MSRSYLAHISAQPCCACRNKGCAPHRVAGGGDRWTVPLCASCLAELRGMDNEFRFWAIKKIDPYMLALRYQVKVR